ncbi:MAG: hypothetical protein JXR71_06635 [Bacteroidales bacterium]|nr:hypothetical protein [Bacteroidales bacterium]
MKQLFSTKTLLLLMALFVGITSAEAKKKKEPPKNNALKASVFNGLKWRGIGPALTSGRIADFSVDPNDHSHFYVASASGGIWVTHDDGTTFKSVFDHYGAYSIGCLAMDPNNHHVVWAGTGENNHQRALGYGNGVWKTTDDGKTWKNMGLKNSRQIGKILIDPRNSDVVYVAAEGSAWGPGEERGLYKTTDGGKTWNKVLSISENTGVANMCFEPGNPDVIYAGAEQRRRRQFSKIGGGPESAFYKTTDGGKTWNKLTNGIPGVDKGGMAIAVSPANPDIVYVMFEASNGKGGFYRSTNRGASFSKMNDYNSSGQYYSEIYPDPKDPDKVYSVDTYGKVTTDGGKTWKNMGNYKRHVDDHAYWIDPKDTKHMLIGCDGGVYETWNGNKTFDFKNTLPVTQFYRVFADNSYPFYWVYGGTQDNNSIGGPSQNLKRGGVTSGEWITTLGGDGFWQAVDPNNPDIVYSAYQYGNIYRYDKKSGESIKIKPMPKEGEKTFRWNWDAPFILSTHQATRLYMGANKIFESDDRGNSWREISGDVTRDEDRNQFKVMGKYWPADAVAKDVSTSQWGTVVSLAESPVKEGMVVAGTDDGVVQVTDNDGKTWTKTTTFPGVPEYTYVSDVLPSNFDENVIYASFNDIKSDDFKPYLMKSSDKGKTWVSIANNLPEESVHTIAQDPVDKNLLFVGTEFGFYFSINGGESWTKLGSGLPDIAVRDIQIQKREKDLVIATFGRGIYIMDDYSALRGLTAHQLQDSEAILFPMKDALMYIQKDDRYGTGSNFFQAPNPPFGATLTYYVKDVPKTLKAQRLKKEKELFKEGKPIPQPNHEELVKEKNETGPYFEFTVTNSKGTVVRKMYKPATTGINRITWNLRYLLPNPIRLRNNKFNPLNDGRSGMLALPGKYTIALSMYHNGVSKPLGKPVSFDARVLDNTTLPAKDRMALDAFFDEVSNVWRVMSGAERYLDNLYMRTAYVQQAIQITDGATLEMKNNAQGIKEELEKITYLLDGSPAKASFEEVPPEQMPLSNRLNEAVFASWQSTSAPTATQKMNFNIVKQAMPDLLARLQKANDGLKALEKKLDELKAPYTPGRFPSDD